MKVLEKEAAIEFVHGIAHFHRDIEEEYSREVVQEGLVATTFFELCGLRAFAAENGGACTFRLCGKVSLYQINNEPLFDDGVLSPTTYKLKGIFGEHFMGACPYRDPVRLKKRGMVSKAVAKADSLLKLVPMISFYTRSHLALLPTKALNIESFTFELILHLASVLPGILDLRDNPLNNYKEYKEIMQHFVEIAAKSSVGYGASTSEAMCSLPSFVAQLLSDNFTSILNAPNTNIIKQLFAISGQSFTEHNVSELPDEFLKEIGAMTIPLYETTSLILYWMVCFIESDQQVKEQVILDSEQSLDLSRLSYIDLAVLEGVRLSGGNPVVFSREILTSTAIKLKGQDVFISEGMQVWLDRRGSNQDELIFPNPKKFDVKNITAILMGNDETIFSVLGHSRYEVNSFTAVNTFRNPRKCPGRYLSIIMVSVIIREIYKNYNVDSSGVELSLRRHCVLPRPENRAQALLQPKKYSRD